MTRIFVFPGQGSQFVGMGQKLFSLFPAEVRAADQLLGYSVEKLCLQDKDGELNQTQHAQPALFVVNALTFLKKLRDTGQPPDYVAGHSLGEYNALFAAGVFDFATGIQLVKERGLLMSRASGGGMAAVIGLTSNRTKEILQRAGLSGLDIANYNAPTQTVISGPKEEIARAQSIFEKEVATMYVPLRVSAAFHSRYMTQAANEFARFLEPFRFASPQIPVIANISARPYLSEQTKSTLAGQINSPVRWFESMEYLLRQPNPQIEEIGPGNVLTGLVRKIKAAMGQ